jgi:hypothetical protein
MIVILWYIFIAVTVTYLQYYGCHRPIVNGLALLLIQLMTDLCYHSC